MILRDKVIPSALNYTGGKYRLLSQIFPYFPDEVDKFVDLFCGGCNIGINISDACESILLNDVDENVIGLFNAFKSYSIEYIFDFMKSNIKKYELSDVNKNGYEYYGCNSLEGLSKYNNKGYYKLRSELNEFEEKDNEYYLFIYLLVVYAFNNQIRFNDKGKFNSSVGKRDFNIKMQTKLKEFLLRLKEDKYILSNKDFRDIDLKDYTCNSFFYVDPPYLITNAYYNKGWSEIDEKSLLDYLDRLNDLHIKFALSNVLEIKGLKNQILIDWINSNEYLNVYELNYDYNNSNFHKIDRQSKTKEVLITNYKGDK